MLTATEKSGVKDSYAPESPILASIARALRSPLWLCLLLALGTHLWMIYHTHGLIDGDEAQVGVQAMRILQGERPVYFYGQPYMGSLAAYIIALLFAIGGISVWTLRLEPTLLALVEVWLTWKLAELLAQQARLPYKYQRRFMFISALVAAMPPLYDFLLEMRVWNGYIETYTLSLALLYLELRLANRWREEASLRELVARWSGVGFLIGLGFWIDPIVEITVAVCAVWFLGFWGYFLLREWRQSAEQRQATWRAFIRGLPPLLCLVPALMVGFAPGIYWGAQHNWENIFYLLHPGSNLPADAAILAHYPTQLERFAGVVQGYVACDAPRALSGAVPGIDGLHVLFRVRSPGIVVYTLTFLIMLVSLLISCVCMVLSCFNARPLLVSARKLLMLPLLFSAVTAAAFCASKVPERYLLHQCGEDMTGHYATPLVIALPLLLAGILTLGSLYLRHALQSGQANSAITAMDKRQPRSLATLLPFVILLVYLGAQAVAYERVPVEETFRAPGCPVVFTQTDQVLDYLHQKHITRIWSTIWIGNVLMFKSHLSVLSADPRIFTVGDQNRISEYTQAVARADRPSVLFFVLSNVSRPPFQQELDQHGVTYRSARFRAGPGVDIVVLTPLSRSLSPNEGNSLQSWSLGC